MMSKNAPSRTEIGLVLQGGGALGAYECGAVTLLIELIEQARSEKNDVALKVVTGVSIGAINAACVAGASDLADGARRLNNLWDDLTLIAPSFWTRAAQRDLSLFGLPGFYAPRTDYLNFARWNSFYDTTPLLKTLKTHVDFVALNSRQDLRFVISAVDVRTGELKRFSNQPLRAGKTSDVKESTGKTEIEPRHILASGSVPPQFPWTDIGAEHYWDGGLVNNTPIGDAVDALSAGDDIRRVVVTMNLYPLKGRLPRNMLDVEDRLHEIAFGNRMLQDRGFAETVNELVTTIEMFAARAGKDGLPAELKERLDHARKYKLVEVVNIDMQTQPDGEATYDDADGLRDFSPETVTRRRKRGAALARHKLARFLPTQTSPDKPPGHQASKQVSKAA